MPGQRWAVATKTARVPIAQRPAAARGPATGGGGGGAHLAHFDDVRVYEAAMVQDLPLHVDVNLRPTKGGVGQRPMPALRPPHGAEVVSG